MARIWIVEDCTDYSDGGFPVLFTDEQRARDYIANTPCFTDGRALLVAETDTDESADQIEYFRYTSRG